jgi:hypothetical protein
MAGEDSTLRRDVWMLLAEMGQPNDILTYAVGATGDESNEISASLKAIFSRKFVELGLPKVAHDWLSDVRKDVHLEAIVALANKDGQAALVALATDLPEPDPVLLARAFQETGNYAQAASLLRGLGEVEEALRLERWAGLWDTNPEILTSVQHKNTEKTIDLSDQGPSADVWAALAAVRTPLFGEENQEPLEASQTHLDDSTITREKITDLLNAVPEVMR